MAYEYESKKQTYAAIGVRYYIIYNPERVKGEHQPLEIYHLENGAYLLQAEEPFWMPEVGLGIGRSQGTYRSWIREWLYWFDRVAIGFPRPQKWLSRSTTGRPRTAASRRPDC